MMNPTIEALKELGGSGTNDEITEKVGEIMNFTDEQLEVPHGDKGRISEIAYRLGWSRTYLKQYGILENSERGIWALTVEGHNVTSVDPYEVRKHYSEMRKLRKADENDDNDNFSSWKDELLATLKKMDPAAFERLTQRVLRESGFTQVEVTGRSGDGGIDGKGIMRLAGLLSFNVIFQCKRHQGSVSAGTVRDFRGAMIGRADKGLLITTGTFTKGAIKEATRDGAPTIDLIDGELLMDKLKELGLGVKTEIKHIETVIIDAEWFLIR